MCSKPEPPQSVTLQDAINASLSAGYARIRSFEHGGKRYWLKQREQLGLRYRLQKGNASRAFDAERQAFPALSDLGVPVASLAASGQDWIVLEDGGRSLREILRRDGTGTPDGLTAFAAAGRGLAAWHMAQVSHGRPAIKDILWDGARITFIDLERYAEARNSMRGRTIDLIVFVHSIFSAAPEGSKELEAAVAAYREAEGEAVWARAQKLCRRLIWLKPLLAVTKLRRPGRARDVQAVGPTLAYFTAKT